MSTGMERTKSTEFVSAEEQVVVAREVVEERVEVVEGGDAPVVVEENKEETSSLTQNVVAIVKNITDVAMKKAEEIQENETYKNARNSVVEKTGELKEKVVQSETYAKVSEKTVELKEAIVNHPQTIKACEKFSEAKEAVANNETVGKMIETSWSVAEMTKEKSVAAYECAKRRSSEMYIKYEETGVKENVEKISAIAVEYLKEGVSKSVEYAHVGFVFSKKMTKKYTADYAKYTTEILEAEASSVKASSTAAADDKESTGDKLTRYQRRQMKNAKKPVNDIDFDAVKEVVADNIHKAKICILQLTGMIAGKITENIADIVEEEAEVAQEEATTGEFADTNETEVAEE